MLDGSGLVLVQFLDDGALRYPVSVVSALLLLVYSETDEFASVLSSAAFSCFVSLSSACVSMYMLMT